MPFLKDILPVAIITLLAPAFVQAARNVSIDDTFGDPETGALPIFLPELHAWDTAICSYCYILPEKTKIWRETWTAGTYDSARFDEISIEFSFTGACFMPYPLSVIPIPMFFKGVQFWVYLVPGGGSGNLRYYVTIDDGPRQEYTWMYEPPDVASYSVPVFSAAFSDQDNAPHSVKVSCAGEGHNYVWLTFDRAVYT
jgi:hypothetical protein